MRVRTWMGAIGMGVSLHPGVAFAQPTLTLSDVLARARAAAPRIVEARLALEETRGRLVGASLRRQTNPELEAAIGNRSGPDSRSTDFELGLWQGFEPGARRSARLAGANAAIAQASANVDEVTRIALRDAGVAFFRALHADARIRLLATAQDLAVAVLNAADRRFRAGDIAVLDVNLARASLARVRAEREAGEAAKLNALGALQQLLGLEGDVTVAGTLSPPPGEPELSAALRTVAQRPELRALEAAIEEAEAERRIGLSFSKPEYAVGLRYASEERDRIVLGGLTLTLPIFSKGQEQHAVASARAARLRAELDAARLRVRVEVRTALDAYTRRLAAVRLLETEVTPVLDENEQLSTRSFEVGQLGLPELLVVRHEILDSRFQHLDALLEAALARTDLDASAGVLR